MSKHTPGPWLAERGGAISANDRVIATLAMGQQRNAALIAAAPELLAEAIELLRNATYADGQATVLTKDCEALELAIAKAEGRAVMRYIIVRNDGMYVARFGSVSSYTKRLQNAQTFAAREEAQRHCCGNERVIMIEEAMQS